MVLQKKEKNLPLLKYLIRMKIYFSLEADPKDSVSSDVWQPPSHYWRGHWFIVNHFIVYCSIIFHVVLGILVNV